MAQTPLRLADGITCEFVVESQVLPIAYFGKADVTSCNINNGDPKVWRTDGTADGTWEIGPTEGSDFLWPVVEVNNRIYFAIGHIDAGDAATLFVSDGMPNSAEIVSRASGGGWELDGQVVYYHRISGELRRVTETGFESIGQFETHRSPDLGRTVILGDAMIFSGDGELWRTDGTLEGTWLLKQINSQGPSDVRVIGPIGVGQALFVATDESGFETFWTTDGTKSGTISLHFGYDDGRLTQTFANFTLIEPIRNNGPRTRRVTDGKSVIDLLDIAGPTRPWIPGRSPERIPIPTYNLGDELYFEADDHLWKTDGTPAGTKSIVELGTGVTYDANPGQGFRFHATDAYFYFEQSDPAGLFQVDRSTGETTRIVEESVDLQGASDKFVIYTVTDTSWLRDDILGTPVDINSELGVTFESAKLELLGGSKLLFQGMSERDGPGFWTTDGTSFGTRKVSELPTASSELDETDVVLDTDARTFFQLGDRVIFNGGEANLLCCSSGIYSIRLDEAEELRGDLNGDGAVTFADFLILATNFGIENAAPEQGDIDEDGTVTFDDFVLLRNSFGKSRG